MAGHPITPFHGDLSINGPDVGEHGSLKLENWPPHIACQQPFAELKTGKCLEPPPFSSPARDAAHAELRRCRAELKELRRRVRQLEEYHDRLKCHLSPERLVPNEILCCIFEHLHSMAPEAFEFRVVTKSVWSRPRPPKLPSVCRRWREVAISMPQLWTRFRIERPRLVLPGVVHGLKVRLSWTKDSKTQIAIKFEPSKDYHDGFRADSKEDLKEDPKELVSHLNPEQWQKLEISGNCQFQGYFSHSARYLNLIELDLDPRKRSSWSWNVPDANDHVEKGFKFPNLTHLSFNQVCVPFVSNIDAPKTRVLKLRQCDLDPPFVKLLPEMFPDLESIALEESSMSAPADMECFRNLKVVKWQGTRWRPPGMAILAGILAQCRSLRG